MNDGVYVVKDGKTYEAVPWSWKLDEDGITLDDGESQIFFRVKVVAMESEAAK